MVRCTLWPFIYFSEATVEDRVSAASCLQEHEIEDLVRGKMSPDVEKQCQAHLLWCQSCQTRLEEEAAFAEATRRAAALLAQDEAEAAKPENS